MSPFRYMGIHGISWGSHGQKASYGASVRLRVTEMNFTPVFFSSIPRRRMLGSRLEVDEHESDDGG